VMAETRRSEDETRQFSERPRRSAQSYHSDLIEMPEDHGRIPGRPVPAHHQDREEFSARRHSNADYPPRHLFDPPERVDQPAYRPDQETRYRQTEQVLVNGSSGHGGSALSQSSIYDSPSSGSRVTQLSSRSSYSTGPSSVQSTAEGRRRVLGQEVTQYPPRRSNASQYNGSMQGSLPATESYTDPRTGERVTVGTRPGVLQRARLGSAMEPDDDPPDWDETPNFRGFARGT
jgi:hypothetical protein